jgi:DNA-binding CsgD family transcriptional regulator
VLDRPSFQRLSLYQHFYRHVGVEYQVAFTLAASRPLIIGLALCRERTDFSDAEVELLALARPHLMHAYRHAQMLGARAALLAALQDGYDRLGHHLVALDQHGRVELATSGARRLLGTQGLSTLPTAISEWLAGRDGQRHPIEPLVLAGQDGRVLVHALPIDRDEHRRLLLIESEHGELSAAALAGLGLTRREAQVLALVAGGKSPADTAQVLSISRRTVEKHLHNIYKKLGTHTLADTITSAWAAIGLPVVTQPAEQSR